MPFIESGTVSPWEYLHLQIADCVKSLKCESTDPILSEPIRADCTENLVDHSRRNFGLSEVYDRHRKVLDEDHRVRVLLRY